MAETVLPLVTDEQASPEVRAVFDKFKSALGFVPNLVRLWSHSPLLFGALTGLEAVVGAPGKVPGALKELAMARTSELNGCPYCKAFHHDRLKRLGTPADKDRSLALGQPPPGLFTDEELAVLKLADEMTMDVQASAATVERVARLFGTEGAIELMACIAMLNLDNRMAYSAALPPDAFPR
jgi:AhpD family alkylhydroperoxidase